MNKIDYELSVWNETINVELNYVQNVNELVIGETYYVRTDLNFNPCCSYFRGVSTDKSWYNFHAYNETEFTRDLQVPIDKISKYVQYRNRKIHEEKLKRRKYAKQCNTI